MGKKINSAGIWINQDIKPKKYIVISNAFSGVNTSACPCVGQVATNCKLLAYFLYYRWNRFACKNLDNGYTIAVLILKRKKIYPYNTASLYEQIKG